MSHNEEDRMQDGEVTFTKQKKKGLDVHKQKEREGLIFLFFCIINQSQNNSEWMVGPPRTICANVMPNLPPLWKINYSKKKKSFE